ncbi:prenyltransferase/squalene oxidase repeat-containing protein [Nocardia sp. NPDC005825]|uniref:prenyltransferase/squalene oxidase repeat-containing protein n=1 Tax=unclassified Nocardia TaxID=2637762 RepID=UPI0033F0F401
MTELLNQHPALSDNEIDSAIARSVQYLFDQQRADGLWTDTLPSSAVGTAPALIALHFHSREHDAAAIAAGAQWLRRTQLASGGWGDTPDDPPNLHGTAFAVGALAIVDPDNSATAIERGLAFIDAEGGLAALSDRDRTPLSPICLVFWELAGLCSSSAVPRIPLELALLPQSLRQRMSFTVPGIFALGLMQARTRRRAPLRRLLDRLAERPALSYLERLQRFEGYIGGFEESPMLVGVVLLGLARAGIDDDMVRRCRDYLLATRRADGSWSVNRDLELTASTAVLMGLQEAGYTDDPRLRISLYRIMSAQRAESFHATGVGPGGWSWSMPSGWPDTDDTACALTVIPPFADPKLAPQVRLGVEWLLRMQRPDGSWGCFVTKGIVGLDAPCPMLTAHIIEALQISAGLGPHDPPVRKALDYLESAQNPDGSFTTIWYRNHVMGTAAVLSAFGKFSRAQTDSARRARAWLTAAQLDDGGWGDGAQAAASTEETAWALYALLQSGTPATEPSTASAAHWLAAHQLGHGGWTPTTLGVYFPGLYFNSDHMANGFALRALGAFQHRRLRDGDDD